MRMRIIDTIYYKNGSRYKGELLNGEKDGKGTYYYTNGNKYEGEWRNDAKDGKGIMYYKS